MAAYVIFKINVLDSVKLSSYQRLAPSIIEKYGGKIIVRGGDTVSLEGNEESRRIVIIEFESMEAAQKFYRSPEYTNAISLRKGAAEFDVIAVNGII